MDETREAEEEKRGRLELEDMDIGPLVSAQSQDKEAPDPENGDENRDEGGDTEDGDEGADEEDGDEGGETGSSEYEMEEEEEEEEVEEVYKLCREGNFEAVREILRTDSSAVYIPGLIHEPSSMPAENIGIEMFKLLLAHGAFINSREEPEFYTPLHIASLLGREKMCEFLLANGARYSLTLEHSRETPFHKAGNLEVVKAFIR